MKSGEYSAELLRAGRRLELGVQAIERAILSNAPELAGATISVSTPRVHEIDGVRFDTDVCVSVQKEDQAEETFIFEYKNWASERVDPREIIYFAYKIEALKAKYGYFIARSFSRYAVAAARKYPTLELLTCTEEMYPLIEFPNIHSLTIYPGPINLTVTLDADPGTVDIARFKDPNSLKVVFKGEEIRAEEFFRVRRDEIATGGGNAEGTGEWPVGSYPRIYRRTDNFGPGELYLEDIACTSMDLSIDANLVINRPVAICMIGVEDRGMTVLYNDLKIHDDVFIRFSVTDDCVNTPVHIENPPSN